MAVARVWNGSEWSPVVGSAGVEAPANISPGQGLVYRGVGLWEATSFATEQDLLQLRREFEETDTREIPIGAIVSYYATVLPGGWLWCDGSAIPAGYTRAIAIIGANTPDLRGRSDHGLDNIGGSDAGRLAAANTLGGTGGSESNDHTHSVGSPLATRNSDGILGLLAADGSDGASAGSSANRNFLPIGFPSASIATTSRTYTSGSASNTNNMPPYLLVNKIIRVL